VAQRRDDGPATIHTMPTSMSANAAEGGGEQRQTRNRPKALATETSER
jgi:hypothetical protein